LIEGEERGNKSANFGRKRSNLTQNREPTVRSKSNLKLPLPEFSKNFKDPLPTCTFRYSGHCLMGSRIIGSIS
jgi:hypothetical protein